MKKYILIAILWVLSLFAVLWYTSPEAKDLREIRNKNKILKLLHEQRTLQFETLMLEEKIRASQKVKQ